MALRQEKEPAMARAPSSTSASSDALETLELFYCDEARALSRKVRQKHQAVAAYFTRALKMKVAC